MTAHFRLLLDRAVTILLNDARLLRVNQRLRSLQTKRIAGSILAKRAI